MPSRKGNPVNPQPIGPRQLPTEWVARLASLVHAIRTDWDEAGIRATLAKLADRPLIDVTHAAINACRRTDQTTPAIIAMDGKHWPAAADTTRTYAEPGVVTYCAHAEPGMSCTICYPRHLGGTGVMPTAEQRARMRADIQAGREHLTTTHPARRH